jgi:uncharacterized membrane protein
MATPPAPAQDPLDQIRDLESRFAAAMTQLYAVGNGLADVRHSLAVRGGAVPVPPSPQSAAPVTPAARSAAVGPVGSAPPVSPPVSSPPGPLTPEASSTATPTGPRPGAPPAVTTPMAPSPAPTPPPAPAGPRWWERPGAVSRVLGVIGAVVTLIGVAMLLAIAIAAGVFGPLPRVIAGALLAGALLAGGAYARRRRPATAGGEALAATGLAAAYLDLLAATALYDFIPGAVGLVLAAVLAVAAFALARTWDSEILAVLAAAPPALLAPAVTGIDSLATISFVAVLLVGSAFAHIGREWPWLYLGRTIPAVGVLLVGVGVQAADAFPTLTVAGAAALGMVAAGAVERSRRLEHWPTAAALAASTPLLLGTTLLTGNVLAVAAALAALFLAVAVLVAAVSARSDLSRSLWVAPMASGTILLVIAAGDLSDETHTGIALAVATGAYWLVAGWRRTWPLAAMGALLAILSALAFAEAVLATTGALDLAILASPLTIVHGLALTGLAWLAVSTATAVRGGRPEPTVTRVAAVWAFVAGSTTVVAIGTWLGSLVDETQIGFYGGHAVATALWATLAAILITVVAPRRGDRGLVVRLGLGLIAVAIAKLFLFDLSALSGLFRVVAFVVTGVIVLIVGVAYSRTTEPADRTAP